MSITVNTPQVPSGGPAAVQGWELVPLGQVSTAQAANAYTVYLNGALTVSIENRSNAAIMIQLLPFTSVMTGPFVRFIDPGVERTFSWQWPLEALIISNLTVQPLPLGIGSALFPPEPAQQNITTGFLLVSWSNVPASYAGMDQNIITGNAIIPTALEQVALDSQIAPGGTTTNYHETITEDINGLMLLLENSANVTAVSVSGVQTGTPYYAQAGPYSAVIALPVASAYDSTIDLSITTAAGEPCQWYLIGRRDSVLDAVAALDLPPASVTVSGTVDASGSKVQATPVVDVTVAESSPSNAHGFSTYETADGTYTDTAAITANSLFSLQLGGFVIVPEPGLAAVEVLLGLTGVQTATSIMLMSIVMSATNYGAASTYGAGSANPAPNPYPFPMSLSQLLPGNTTYKLTVQISTLLGAYTYCGFTSLATFR